MSDADGFDFDNLDLGMPRNPARRAERLLGTGTERVRKLLTRTWYPFLGRFPQPTRIQQEAIPRILGGEAVLIASATATGKTEAYTAPLVERLLREKWSGGASLLIVSPTRALVNDLFRRLEPPMRQLGVPLGRKTGDYSEIALTSAERDAGEKAAVLVTTPESLDSMLARRPETLKCVRAIVLDELHVLDGTARGDQLAVLVTRLERLVMGVAAQAATRGGAVPLPLQRVAATATAARTEDVARRYLGPRAVVVSTDERREIEAELVASTDPASVVAYFRGLVDADGTVISTRGNRQLGRKVLVFTNSRAEAENMAVACLGQAPFGRDVFVHHASLARQERERVEKRFLGASTALCFATTTLELGIDIGDIDRVGLLGPPPDVPALLQRVGRGNRRSFDTTRVACFYETPAQRARFEHLLDCARRGEIHAGPTVFRPSVLVQQAWSLIYQNRARWIDATVLHERLPSWVSGLYSVAEISELLAHMAHEKYLQPLPNGRYAPADRLEYIYKRGTMHGNIGGRDELDLAVVDAATERVVGYVSAPVQGDMPRHGKRRQAARDLALSNLPSELIIGGRKRQVQKVSDKQIRVTSEGPAGKAQFTGTGSPVIPLALAQSFATFLGIKERQVKVVLRDEVIYLAHFLGSAYGRLLLECLKTSMRGLTAAGNGFVCALARTTPPDLHFSESQVLSAIGKHRRAMSSALSDGPLSGRLPDGWWAQWLQQALDVPAFLALVDTLRLDEEVSDEVADIIVSLSPRHQHG